MTETTICLGGPVEYLWDLLKEADVPVDQVWQGRTKTECYLEATIGDYHVRRAYRSAKEITHVAEFIKSELRHQAAMAAGKQLQHAICRLVRGQDVYLSALQNYALRVAATPADWLAMLQAALATERRHAQAVLDGHVIFVARSGEPLTFPDIEVPGP